MSPDEEKTESLDAMRGLLVGGAIAAGIWATLAVGVATIWMSTAA